MKTKLITTTLALVALALAAAPAVAQVTTTGSIQVIVVDQDDARLPGVTVTATAPDAVTRRTAVTDTEGIATLDAMAPSARYTVTAQMAGFREQTREAILVRSGQVTTLRFGMTLATLTEEVTVMAQASPVVDVTNATTGQDITLELTESLPTGRSYQSYLQLVPGVLPDDPAQPGNPAARSGLNYRDILGESGISRDNFYYLDGINVTDPVTGTFGANMNTEVIQEQKVITGGIPAEFVGSPGLISNVITKSGSNDFHGSINYFAQNEALVADNENGPNENFDTKDNGYTIGGPVWRDKAWFFGSYRYLNREDDVSSLDTNELLRVVDNTQHQGFVKATWAPAAADLVSFSYLSDPTDISGRRERDILNERDRSREQGGNRYAGTYTRVWGNNLVEFGMNKHNGEVSDFSALRETRQDVIFQRTDQRLLSDEQLGGFGRDLIDKRDAWSIRGSMQHTWNRHTIKGGLEFAQHENFRDTIYLTSANYESISARYLGQGISASNIVGGTGNQWTILAFDHSNPSDFGGFIRTVNDRPDRDRFYTAFDTNADGTITQAELGNSLIFNTSAGNPFSQVNYDRTFQASLGPQDTSSEGWSLFIQDQFQVGNRFTFNVGVRAERWEHFATTGESIFVFPWEFAPRLSAVWDVVGDGRHKVSAYYGRYYDPIRNDMTNFAGTLTGSILEEQVYALGEWITYRTRGGPTVQDAFFSPTTETPYTDDWQFGYAVDLGRNMSFEGLYINRRTRDIFEDYDLELYATAQDGQIHYPGPLDHPDSLFLGLDYFGYTENPGSNFVLGTLFGAERNYQGIELVFRKRFDNNWQTLVSYNWNDMEGNSNSDGNADFQGDVDFLDPRAPNQFGRQPGLIEHLFKGGGSYTFDMGLQLGAAFNWNSGTAASRTFRASQRNLPIRVSAADAFEFAGYTNRWIAPDTVGVLTNPSWGTIDMRAQYIWRLADSMSAEFFADIFNLFNNQGAIREQDLVAGTGAIAFGDEIQWLTPRRAFLGARFKF
jgi:hypothetical protein